MKIHPLIVVLAVSFSSASAGPMEVFPVGPRDGAKSLNGDWSFKYLPTLDAGDEGNFFKPDFDVSAWKFLRVPGNWELQGFAEPMYALELRDGLGLYRRTFRAPKDWTKEGRRVCLRFEGVAYGFQAWVNGRTIGGSAAGAYNPNTFDITDALKPDAENVLAVQVTTKPLGYEFDVNDDWALSGIFRDVTLFSVPAIHVQNVSTQTKLTADGAAELSVLVNVSQPGAEVRGRLFAPDGGKVGDFELTHRPDQSRQAFEATTKVVQPRLWTAETPALYRLQLVLSVAGRPVQTLEERIGLREVSLGGGVLRVNGHPIKMRGVNHHDISPENGRAITGEEMRRDLEMMKKGNINFIRTSHYAPQPRFIELCDEMGFYVMDEVAIGKGEEHLNDPNYRGNILARTEATIARDRNHPSVIIWSIGNENPVNDAENEAARRARELDPSRPVCIPKIGSYFQKNYEKIPDVVAVYAPHYPTNSTLREYAKTLKRPTIFTEYAHALGLATDRIQDQWEIMQKTPAFAGGSIWMFQDQGTLRRSETPVDRNQPTECVWLDAHRYYDSSGTKGADGIVYSDRTPQTDYWQVRKVYSPVQIVKRSAEVRAGPQEISLPVENRHDFRTLAGMKLEWSLLRNGRTIEKGVVPLQAQARAIETVSLPVQIPHDASGEVLALEWRCIDEAGMQLTEGTVRLDLEGGNRSDWLAQLPDTDSLKVTEDAKDVKVEFSQWTLTLRKVDGGLSIRDPNGRVLVEGIYPHSGRKLTMTERIGAKKEKTWSPSFLTEARGLNVTMTRVGSGVRLAVSGTYFRPQQLVEKHAGGDPNDPLLNQEVSIVKNQEFGVESLVGGYDLEITPKGVLTLHYDYSTKNASGRLSEAGLSLLLPAGLTEFRWIGQGIYAGYPGKDRLNEFGLFHLNRDDLRFQGNRRETELALLTDSEGSGVALAAANADIAVERADDLTLLSHNALISGLGNKGAAAENSIKAEKISQIAGQFMLVPLARPWPDALTRWFGKPAAASGVFRPFYHSYDQ